MRNCEAGFRHAVISPGISAKGRAAVNDSGAHATIVVITGLTRKQLLTPLPNFSWETDLPLGLKMPALSQTMGKGNLARRLVGVGDLVKPGDLLAGIETDKTAMEFEAIDEGLIAELLIADGSENMKVGTVIAILSEPHEASQLVVPKPAAAIPAPLAVAPDAALAQRAFAPQPDVSVRRSEGSPASRLFWLVEATGDWQRKVGVYIMIRPIIALLTACAISIWPGASNARTADRPASQIVTPISMLAAPGAAL